MAYYDECDYAMATLEQEEQMKLQRYSVNDNGRPYLQPDNDGNLCESEDVEKLEQLNAEMLEVLKDLLKDEEIDGEYGWTVAYQKKLKSIIEKVEVIK